MSRQIIAIIISTCAILFATRCNTATPVALVMPTIEPSQMPIPTSTDTATPIQRPLTRTPAPTPNYGDKLLRIDRNITYCNIDGVALKLDLYHPSQPISNPLPIVVNIHGGSWSFGDKSHSDSADDIPELVARGYLVAAINYRLAPQWKFPAQIEDVKCAIRFLRANASTYNLDPGRIGAWGCSAGGHLAALAGTTDSHIDWDQVGEYHTQSSRVQAVAILSAPTDITLYDITKRADTLTQVFGVSTNTNPVLVHASPINYVSKDASPFLIFQGDHDNLIDPRNGEKMYARLVADHVSAHLVTVQNGTHCFPSNPSMTPSREQISKMVADFFDQTLHQ